MLKIWLQIIQGAITAILINNYVIKRIWYQRICKYFGNEPALLLILLT